MQNFDNNASSTAISKVVIVGGGTAGWMTAAALSNTLSSIEIRLLESEQIGTVGVGEATIPEFAVFNDILGIDEDEMLRETGGTFKLGIEFVNWGKLGDKYFHPFGGYGRTLDALQFYHFWQRHYLAGGDSDISEYSICTQAARANKFMRPIDKPNSPLSQIDYAFHFDAGLYARYLRKYAEKRGVMRTEGMLEKVSLKQQTGDIAELTLQSGEVIAGDLFIDCTGSNALLIEGALKTGYEDWSHYLPCDRAVTVQTSNLVDPCPYTRSTAHSAGWQWRIPLQHRVGNGHVYSSRYMDDDTARQILLDNIEGEVLTEPRVIGFKTGKRKKFWNKNCVAIGLSSGFMEPLESTSIHLIQSSISKLISLFPATMPTQVEVAKYNQMLSDEFDYIRDFLILHYHVTEREDSPFWQSCKTMDIPERLAQKISLYESCGRLFRENFELFAEGSWLAVMHGQGLRARNSHPAAGKRPIDVVNKQLGMFRDVIHRSVAHMPTHHSFIAKHCGSVHNDKD